MGFGCLGYFGGFGVPFLFCAGVCGGCKNGPALLWNLKIRRIKENDKDVQRTWDGKGYYGR